MLSTVWRTTPGMAATGSGFALSVRNSGQIRSSTVSVASRTSRRDQPVRRLRRIRLPPRIESMSGRVAGSGEKGGGWLVIVVLPGSNCAGGLAGSALLKHTTFCRAGSRLPLARAPAKMVRLPNSGKGDGLSNADGT